MLARIRIIEPETYYDLAQNGARDLIELDNFKVVDGTKDTRESYFLFFYGEESNEPIMNYQILPEVACDLMALHYVVKNDEYLLEMIYELMDEATNNHKIK
jgi:hypothetical protein